MKNFIEKYLKINNYEIDYFNTWRNNITALVKTNIDKIIIQKEDKIFSKNQENMIEKIINACEWKITIAWNYFDNRFFEFEWEYYQVMKYLDSINLNENNLKENSILSMFSYLAEFHNISETIKLNDEEKEIKIAIWKWVNTFKSVDILFWEIQALNDKNNKFNDYFEKIKKIKEKLDIIETRDNSLKQWIIHGDTAFKNYVFNKDNYDALALIDYEKIEYNNYIWDLADLIRSLLKVDSFDINYCIKSIEEYEKYRKLDKNEKDKLKSFVNTLVFHVIMQYFSALFPEWSVNNMIWNDTDTIKKLERWFSELEKIKRFDI